jgi:hypothetical protein
MVTMASLCGERSFGAAMREGLGTVPRIDASLRQRLRHRTRASRAGRRPHRRRGCLHANARGTACHLIAHDVDVPAFQLERCYERDATKHGVAVFVISERTRESSIELDVCRAGKQLRRADCVVQH